MITDHKAYNNDMAKSLPEKVFFLGRLHALPSDTLFVDFGCGDGTLLGVIKQAYPEAELWGVEKDSTQRTLARRYGWVEETFGELLYTTGGQISEDAPRVAIFSSVLHEAPHLLEHAIAGEFDYIVIRDMALSDRHRHFEHQLEYLFKAAYWGTPDWDREVKERYFRLSADAVMQAPPGYSTIHFEHHWLAPIMDQITDRHGYCPMVPTHLKSIWARNTQ